VGLIEFIVVAAVIGLAVYLITTYIPMPEPIRKIIIVVACLVVLLVLVRALVGDIQMPRLR
jgi:hypothetical protein